MIEPGHPKLSLSRQSRVLRVSRSSLYHRPKGESAENLALMRRIDQLFLECPFYGRRQMVHHLCRKAFVWSASPCPQMGASLPRYR